MAKISEDIEMEKRDLKDLADRKKKEASTKISEILSKSSLEFCSRCNKKITDRLEWAGKCISAGCESLLCEKCWMVDKKRYCKPHSQKSLGKEIEGKEKQHFADKLEPAPQKQEEKLEDKIRPMVASFKASLLEKLKSNNIDVIPGEHIDKVSIEQAKKQEEDSLELSVCRKSFLRKKGMLKVFVMPLYNQNVADLEFLVSHAREKSGNLYSVIFVVSSNTPANVLNHLRTFNNPFASLIIVEPEKGLHFVDTKPYTKIYVKMADKGINLMQILSTMADKIADRETLVVGKLVADLGFTEEEAYKLLDTCKFLERVEGTDTYFFKQ